ncbi:MAG: hypothetical protein ABJB10_23480, partial [Mesorhizobium sp.]
MILDPVLDLFRGKAVTIPPLDGAFRPNTRLDDAPVFAGLTEPDNLLVSGDRLLATSGNAIYTIAASAEPAVVETFQAPATALALSPSGELTVGLENGKLLIAGKDVSLPADLRCITALTYADDGTLWLANGSADHSPSQWAADLMKKGVSGSLWKRERGSAEFQKVAGDIAFPYGLHSIGKDVLVSESWRHQLVRFDGATGNRSTVLTHLPGYPARLSPAGGGGAWLTLFAPRNRLIEFVLQETHYRQDMIEQVPPAYWIAPALASNRSFLEPLQCGGIRTMGIHKPWSPSRSYGLVV